MRIFILLHIHLMICRFRSVGNEKKKNGKYLWEEKIQGKYEEHIPVQSTVYRTYTLKRDSFWENGMKERD